MPRYVIIRLHKISDKEKILVRGKNVVLHPKRQKIRMTADFLSGKNASKNPVKQYLSI